MWGNMVWVGIRMPGVPQSRARDPRALLWGSRGGFRLPGSPGEKLKGADEINFNILSKVLQS